MLPQALIGLIAGVYVDRLNRKYVMIFSDAFIALCALVLLVILQNENVNLIWIYILLGLRSVGNAFHAPALQAIAPLIVPQNELIKVAGINQVLHSVCSIGGTCHWHISHCVSSHFKGIVLGFNWSIAGYSFTRDGENSRCGDEVKIAITFNCYRFFGRISDCFKKQRFALSFSLCNGDNLRYNASCHYVSVAYNRALCRRKMGDGNCRSGLGRRYAYWRCHPEYFQIERLKSSRSQCYVCIIGTYIYFEWCITCKLVCRIL